MRNIFLLLCICLLAGMVACKKEKFTPLTTPPPGLGGDTWTQDSVDKFIYDSLTVPYNVAVYYKWLPGQLDFPSDRYPFGLTLDSASQRLVVSLYANSNAANRVLVFFAGDSGDVAPLTTLGGASTGFDKIGGAVIVPDRILKTGFEAP